MSEMMEFPDTWEEFEKSYGFTDSKEVYTNGSRLIPSFRVKQWLDHIAQFKTKRQAIDTSDLISKEDAIANVASEIWHYPNELYTSLNCFDNCQELAERALGSLPSAQPDTTQLAQEIWAKVCLITDPEDTNLQHEVIHYGDLKKIFLEVLGWTI